MEKFDVIVIGGGPAGLITAGTAGQKGLKVLLIEANNRLGVKLLMTGKGRCNLTNAEPDLKTLISKYHNGKFLFSSFNQFNNFDLIKFFNDNNLPTKIEANNRVFPASDKSSDVLIVLQKYLKMNKVKVLLNTKVEQIKKTGNLITKIVLDNGSEVSADKYVLATGGKAYPATGSTGAGFGWLKNLGHNIIQPKSALAPLIFNSTIAKDLEGLSLAEADVKIYQNSKNRLHFKGEIIFTAEGVSGPAVLNNSYKIGQMLDSGAVYFVLDLLPDINQIDLDKKLQTIFKKFSNKQIKNSLNEIIQPKLLPIVLKLAKIDVNKPNNSITKVERQNLVKLIKHFEFKVKTLAGFEKAMLTSGGVDLKEIDPKTMKSKLIKNLYLAGEILDVNGPTGGYNLQVCWSTGVIAGQN